MSNIQNNSNLKVVLRIRPPKNFDYKQESKKSSLYQTQEIKSPQSTGKQYTCIRNRTRSSNRGGDIQSPSSKLLFRLSSIDNYHSIRNASKESASKGRSGSKGRRNSLNRSNQATLNSNGLLQEDKKYCIFTTKERSSIAVACENGVPGKVINESLQDTQDLRYFKQMNSLYNEYSNTMLGQSQSFTFNFDAVFNETHKQEKFYSSVVRPAVKSFVEGENACVILFGPTESGKTHTLKGKTGMERGILPRSVEDIFNIVRNSEERDEEFEMFRNEVMMNCSSNEDFQLNKEYQQHSNRGTGYKRVKYDNDTYDTVPERMFLKVSVYQIFVDKVIDLLQGGGTGSAYSKINNSKVKIEHYIDKESEEVVSKLKNISEKVVFTLEDFYSVLQEAFKNRRIESVSMQEQDLRKKTHFVISLTLMKRTQSKRMMEVSTLNFVELSGSEQAVAEEKFFQDSSIRQFVTKSFNSLSSQILRSALKKKASVPSSMDEGDSKIVNCLRNSLTSSSNIILLCCVNPGTSYFEHSLPAIKFCARIRDCIIKKLGKKPTMNNTSKFTLTQNPNLQTMNQSASLDEIEYNQDSDRQQKTGVGSSGALQTTKELLDHLKEQYELKLVQLSRQCISQQEVQNWSIDQLGILEKLVNRIRTENQNGSRERQNYVVLDELQQLKDKILKLPIESKYFGNTYPTRNTYNKTHNSQGNQMIQQQYQGREGVGQRSYEKTYNPFSSQTYSQVETIQNSKQKGVDKYGFDQGYPLSDRKNYYEDTQRPYNYNSDKEPIYNSSASDQYQQHNIKKPIEYQRFDTNQTPQFDHQTSQDSQHSLQQLNNSQHTKLNARQTHQKQQQKNKAREQQKQKQYQGGLQNHFKSPSADNKMEEIEIINDNSNIFSTQKQQEQKNNPIKIYQEIMEESKSSPEQESPKNKVGYRGQKMQGAKMSKLIEKQQQQQMNQEKQQVVSFPENDFLNKAHPILDVSLTGERNDVSLDAGSRSNKASLSPVKKQSKNSAIIGGGFRGGHGSNQKKQSQFPIGGTTVASNNNSMFGNNSKISLQQQQPILKNQKSQQVSEIYSGMRSMQQDLSKQRLKIQNDSVYQNEEEAIADLNRLMKLNDFEGIKLRVRQIYKEKQEQEKIMEQVDNQSNLMINELEKKDQMIEEYDKALKENQQEYQITLVDLNNQKEDSVKEFGEKAATLSEQVHLLTLQIKTLNAEKDKLKQVNEELKKEHTVMEKQKSEAERKFEKEKEECDKFRANYDILKEHEVNIIKDYEGKKTKELSFFEQTIQEQMKQIKDQQQNEKELEEQIFKLREEIRRGEFEQEKVNQDRKHMIEQIEKLGEKLEKEEEQNQALLQQIDQNSDIAQNYEQQMQKVEQERDKAFEEIQQLHRLIEEMEKSIQQEQERAKEEQGCRKEKDELCIRQEQDLKKMEEELERKEGEMQEMQEREEELKKQLARLGKMNNEIDMNLTKMKAKEYDKVDVLKQVAEAEARCRYLEVDNENLVKERNNLDLANVELSRMNAANQQQIMELNQELEFFRNTHEELLDKFDQKIEQITTELTKLKNENIALKEKDKSMKRVVKDLEAERDEFQERFQMAERKSEDFNQKLFEMEREVRQILQDREREMKDSAMKQTMELRHKEENKRQLLEDIQNLIKEKKKLSTKNQGMRGGGGDLSMSGHSLHNSNLN